MPLAFARNGAVERAVRAEVQPIYITVAWIAQPVGLEGPGGTPIIGAVDTVAKDGYPQPSLLLRAAGIKNDRYRGSVRQSAAAYLPGLGSILTKQHASPQ